MQYTLEIDIALPRDRVVELFDDPNNMHQWQPDLVSFTHLSGEPGQVGAKSKLVYQMGQREVEMIETITERDLPETFAGTYEAQGVWNSVHNRFAELQPDWTRWTFDTEFRCSGVIRIFALLMPWSFKKKSLQFMQQFKAFAESTRQSHV